MVPIPRIARKKSPNGNHIHLLIKESDNISNVIKRISSSYVYWYNLKYERCGHLFQERFKSENVDSIRYFLTVLRYIHQNPLKAGLFPTIFECKWTSIHEYLHKATIIDVDYPLQFFSSDRKQALLLFKDYMEKPNDDQCLEDTVRIRLTDDEVKRYLFEIGVSNINMLQHMDKEERDSVLFRLKAVNGISLRQIARVTGISKSVIQRAGK
ncbi:transposase [Bacillus sp. J37]|uniref:transposase n=1 Tax=Bacillus sp. J37 TaxID=935837 RepID=UPI0004B267CF|nr:transposase [Bacillus sp. J37]